MTAPTITIIQDFETDLFHLMATSFSVTNPAGPRLFRGGSLPLIQFTHVDQASAERDCALLQNYVTLAWAGKAPKAKGREEKSEAPKLSVFDIKNAVWSI